MQRIQKLLNLPRRKAEELIKVGRVRVNDRIVTLGEKASENDKIYVDNKLVSSEKKVYIVFNKPVGCVTAATDKKFKTVLDYVKVKERVFPVGRLDYNTSGLLLLTNDGEFANKITHPSHEIEKTYQVTLSKPITKEDISKLEKGIVLEDGKTSPAKVNKISEKVIDITIHEGKNRIVRRMVHALGYAVKTLERIAIGKLTLSNLKVGEWRYLTKEQVSSSS